MRGRDVLWVATDALHLSYVLRCARAETNTTFVHTKIAWNGYHCAPVQTAELDVIPNYVIEK